MADTTTAQLLVSLAQHLDDAGLAQYQPSGGYVENPTRPAVFFEKLPTAPDTALALTVYNDLRDRDAWNPDIYVRMRWRAAGQNPLTVNEFADAMYEFLDTREPTGPRQTWPGGVNVLTCFRVVRAQSVMDANGRFMRADSYRITINPGEGAQ